MIILAACWFAHVVISALMSSPWWVPNVTLVGWVMAIGRAPNSWGLCSLMAAMAALLWLIRWTHPIVIGYLALGWMLSLLARRWDLTDERVFILIVAATSTAATLGLLWLEELRSWPVLGLALAQILVTTMSAVVIRRLVRWAPRD